MVGKKLLVDEKTRACVKQLCLLGVMCKVSNRKTLSGDAREEPTSVHSLKWNPNVVLTTCKAIIKGFASGFVYWSCTNQRFWKGIKNNWPSKSRLFLTILFFGNSQIPVSVSVYGFAISCTKARKSKYLKR